jgi:hypothetical protein
MFDIGINYKNKTFKIEFCKKDSDGEIITLLQTKPIQADYIIINQTSWNEYKAEFVATNGNLDYRLILSMKDYIMYSFYRSDDREKWYSSTKSYDILEAKFFINDNLIETIEDFKNAMKK